jgi:DNA-binding winged helix-turn-helix (wHTH) protein/Flp pilus assembly protein TadD
VPTETLQTLTVGPWRAELRTGRLSGPEGVREVEPKVMDLLFLLASDPGRVFSREEILAALWPGLTVGEDALSRTVFKLRKALGDDPKAPRFVETLPKRGYRLIAGPAPADVREPSRPAPLRRLPLLAGLGAVALAAGLLVAVPLVLKPHSTTSDAAARESLTRRADDAYFQYTRADNEAAVVLYERAIAARPDDAEALAGLANALVQRVVRWPEDRPPPAPADTTLRAALKDGRTASPAAVRRLARARSLAERAVRLAPRDPAALKALGFVLTAQGEGARARELYERALAVDPNAWGVLINLAELDDIAGRPDAALTSLEQAWAAMARVYDAQAVRVRPWHARLGVLIADRHAAAGRPDRAETWYRRVLADAPLDPNATAGLARLLAARGDRAAADKLCADLIAWAGPQAGCRPAGS